MSYSVLHRPSRCGKFLNSATVMNRREWFIYDAPLFLRYGSPPYSFSYILFQVIIMIPSLIQSINSSLFPYNFANTPALRLSFASLWATCHNQVHQYHIHLHPDSVNTTESPPKLTKNVFPPSSVSNVTVDPLGI